MSSTADGESPRRVRQLREHSLLIGKGIFVGLVVTLGIFYLLKKITTPQAGVLFGLIVALLCGISVSEEFLRSFPNRIAKISVGSVSVALQTVRQGVAASATDEGDRNYVGTLYDLRIKLEYKIAYLAKHVLLNPSTGLPGTFVNIGSLKYDKLLNEDQARTAYMIMALGSGEPIEATRTTASEIMKAANSFVSNIRATVFYALVREIVKNVDPDYEETTRWRRTTFKTSALGEPGQVLLPVFAERINDARIERLVNRIRTATVSGVIIVIVRSKEDDETTIKQRNATPAIWTLGHLREQLYTNRSVTRLL